MATLAILQNRAVVKLQLVNEHLTVALDTRVAIEQAKGVVSERTGLDMDQSFSRMRNHAARHHVRLLDLAQDIADRTLDAVTLDHWTDR
jgi:AmiR/NasT family two-component response regulator